MPDQLTQYYDYLKKAGADVPPTFESFKSTLSDEPSAKQYYNYLKSNKFDAPDTFDSFANTLGLKKKEPSVPSAPVSGQPSSVPSPSPSQLPSVFKDLSKEINIRNVSDSPSPTAAIQTRIKANEMAQGVKPTMTVAEKHQKEVEAARKKVDQAIQNSDPILTRMIREGRVFDFEREISKTPTLDGFVNPAINTARKDIILNSPVKPEEIATKKQEALQNDATAREVLRRSAKNNKDVAKSAYLLDAEQRAAENPLKVNDIVRNADKIAAGELRYNIKSGVLEKPENPFESIIRGFKERSQQLNDYEAFTTGSDQDVIAKLEKERASYDPDKPVPVADGGTSQFTQMLGMEGVPMVKSAAAAVLTNAIPGGQAAAPYVAAFVSSPEYYKRSYSSALRDAYFELRNKGVSEDEALATAKKQAESEGILGAAEGVVSSAIGARVGLKPTPIIRSSGVKGALENIVRAGGNFIKENAPEGLTDAGVAGALQIAKNIEARDNGLDRDILDGVDDNVVGELMFTFGMGTLVHGGKAVVNDKTYKTIVSALARQPKEAVDAKIGEMVVTGKATPKRAAEIGKEIDEVRAVDSKIPDEVEDVAVRTEIVDKIKQRDELKAKLAKVDEAFHPEIRQEIAKVEDEIKGLSSAQELSKLESGMAVDQAGQLTINRDGIKSNATVETDRIKSAAPEEETGVTMNLDGTTYTGGGLVIPAASMNTTQEELTPEMLADFIEQNKSKLGDGETFKVGYYKFPNSNQVSIDLNIVADPKNRETALRFGRMAGQESLFDLDTFENVKTGADGMNPRSFSDEEFADIARSLKDGNLPSFMDVASRAKSFIIGEDETTSNVAEALKPTGIRITELPAAEFEARVKEVGGQGSEEGVFIADNGEIILNKDTASDITKIHEGAHPVMNIIYNTNRGLYDQAIAGMQQAAANNQGIQGAIEFGQQYEGEATQNDEALVETIARIGTGDIDINTIDTGFKQALIDLVNRIAKVFGFEQLLNDTDVAAFKRLAARVAEALRDGKDITDIVGEENLSNYQNNIGIPATIEANQFRVPDTKAPFVYEAKDVEQLPVKSLQDIFDQFGGKAVVINSDPTRVGELTLPSGKKIFMYGGPGYLSIKDNVSGNVGFATTQIGKVNSWGKYVSQLFGNSPGVTLVATQAPTSILSNSYALRYVMDAVSMLPKSVLRSSDFKNEFFGKDLVLLKDAFGEKGYNDFVNKYKKADLSDPKVIDGMIAEMGYKIGDDNKPASFKARGAFVSNLLGGLVAKDKVKGVEGDTGYVSKNPQKFIAKQLKDRLDINAEKVMRDIGEPSLVDVWMNEGKWGFVVSGFETDPNISTESIQANGIKHPLFNAKFPGKNPFILDGAYEVDEMFQPIEMTGPAGAPYTKRASQMLAGSMYVKGQSLNEDGSFDFAPTESTAGRIQASKSRDLVSNAGLRKQMTEDGDNYVFFHYSDKKIKQVDPSKFGKNLATGRDERPGVGISMYYTRPDQLETNVPGDYGYSVRIPKDKVYPFNQDPLNLMPQAEKLFKKDYPGQAFDTNKQVGYVTKVAADRGYPMTVAEWTINGKKGLRAQTTEKLTVKPYRVKDPMYLNVYEFKEEFTPNALKKGQFSKSRLTPEESAIIDQSKANGTYMKAPNGKPTKLNEKQWAQVRTKNFKNWFGDWENDPANASKVVDENGEPMVVYHGTGVDFESFDGSDYYFFSPDPSFAEEYSSTFRYGRIIPSFLNARKVFNPSKLNANDRSLLSKYIKDEQVRMGESFSDAENIASEYIRKLVDNSSDNWVLVEQDAVKKFVSDNRYDSMYVRESGIENIAVINPNQVKSAIANTGEFNPADNRIQASKSRLEKDKNFKIAAFVMKEKAEGTPDQEIFDGIKSVMPNMSDAEIVSAVSDPEGFIRTKFSNLSSAVQENLISRARVTKTTAGMPTDIDPAFGQLETRPEDIEAATQRPSKVEEIKKKVNEVKNKYFDAAQGLPNWIMGVKDITGGVRDLEIRKAVDLSKELKKVAASIGFTDWNAFIKAMKSLTPQAVQASNSTEIQPWYANIAAQNKVLSMPPAVIPAEIAALPEEIRPYVFAMRGMVDGLTKDLIGAGFVTPEQAKTLESNIGSYLNRAYRLFNENGYKPSDEDFKQAVKYFSDIYIKQLATQNAGVLTFEQVSKQAAEMARKTVNEILDKDLNPYFKKGEKRDVSILKERKDIPEPIRKLMGEYTDPVTVFVMTVAKQAALRGASQYLTALRNNGMGTMFFEKNDPNRPAEFSREIAGEGSETMSPLNGLYTTPEIAEALNGVKDTLNSLTQTWMKLVGAIRWGKTVGSVVTQVKNMLSNIGFAVMNGLIFTGKNGKALSGASQYWSGQVTGRKLDDLTQKVMALGLVNQSVGASELKRMLGSADMHDIAVELAVTGKSKGAINWIGKPFRALNKAYQLSDDFWKVYAYMNERELVSNAMFGEKYDNLTPEQQVDVDLESSERVKNTWPTYSRVWEGAKYVSERAPIFGNFISFQAESVRVLGNTFKLAMADIKSGDPAFAAIGYKRLAGMITYVGLRSALTYAAAHAAGIGAAGLMGLFDDDEEKNKEEGLRTALPAFMRTGDLLAIPQKDGQYTVFDLSSIDPYGIVFKSLNALTEGREGIVGDKMEPGVAAAMAEFFSGFLEPEMTFRVMMDVANNSNPKTGGAIYREDDSRSEALLNVGKYVGDQLKPSTIGFVERLMGDNRKAEIGAVFGARPYEVDLYRSFGRVMATNGKNFEDIIKEYNRVKYDKKATEAEKKEAEKKAEQDIAYYADKMSRVYRQFVSLGADPKKLNEMIANKSQVKSTGWSKGLKRSIKTGEITPDKYLK